MKDKKKEYLKTAIFMNFINKLRLEMVLNHDNNTLNLNEQSIFNEILKNLTKKSEKTVNNQVK